MKSHSSEEGILQRKVFCKGRHSAGVRYSGRGMPVWGAQITWVILSVVSISETFSCHLLLSESYWKGYLGCIVKYDPSNDGSKNKPL